MQGNKQELEGAIPAAGMAPLLKSFCSYGLLPLAGTPRLLRGQGCCVSGLCSALGLHHHHLNLTRFAQVELDRGRGAFVTDGARAGGKCWGTKGRRHHLVASTWR